MAGSTIEDATGRITKKLRVDLHENCQAWCKIEAITYGGYLDLNTGIFFFFKGLLIILRGYH